MIPPVAAAKASYYPLEAGHATHVHLRGSAGYRIGISANDRRYVTLKASKAGASTEYQVRGRRTEEFGISARLPGRGSVQLRFIPNGREHRFRLYSNCDGPGAVVREGVVKGRIRFTGEGGYTRVRAGQARAEVVRWERQRCRYLEPGKGPRRKKRASLSAFSPGSPLVEFSATRFAAHERPASRQVAFRASVDSTQGRMEISRSISVPAERQSFMTPEPKTAPEQLVLSPPPPFSGTASFLRTPESTFAWEGTLSVLFPGTTRPLHLVGPDFIVQYCALLGCIDRFPADEAVGDFEDSVSSPAAGGR